MGTASTKPAAAARGARPAPADAADAAPGAAATGLHAFLPLVGFSFWQAWWMLLSTSDLVCGPVHYGARTINLVLLMTLVGYAVLAALAPRLAPYAGKGAFAAAGGACLVGCLAVAGATHASLPAVPGAVLVIAAVGVISAGNALLLLMWGERWSTLAAGDVGRQLCASFAFAFVLYFAIYYLPDVPGAVLVALLAPLSALALSVSQSLPCRTGTLAPIELRARPVVTVLASILAFSVVFGCMNRYAYSFVELANPQSASMLVAGVLIGLFALVMGLRGNSGDPFSFYRPVVPAIACGALVCLMTPAYVGVVGHGILVAGIYCLDMFIMFSAPDLAYRCRRPVALVFGAAIVAARGGTLLGTWLGTWVVSSPGLGGSDLAHDIVLAVVCIAVLAGTVLFTETDLRALYQPETKPHVPDLDERCEAVAASAGLSARELDVMRLLARGRSVAVISETLGIAQGTVKHHASNTYRKLGVYDRQGLIDVVAGDTGEQQPQ